MGNGLEDLPVDTLSEVAQYGWAATPQVTIVDADDEDDDAPHGINAPGETDPEGAEA